MLARKRADGEPRHKTATSCALCVDCMLANAVLVVRVLCLLVRSGIWDAESGREVLATPARVKRLGAVGFDSIMGATAWHPTQHVIALGAFGDGSPIVLYCREVSP